MVNKDLYKHLFIPGFTEKYTQPENTEDWRPAIGGAYICLNDGNRKQVFHLVNYYPYSWLTKVRGEDTKSDQHKACTFISNFLIKTTAKSINRYKPSLFPTCSAKYEGILVSFVTHAYLNEASNEIYSIFRFTGVKPCAMSYEYNGKIIRPVPSKELVQTVQHIRPSIIAFELAFLNRSKRKTATSIRDAADESNYYLQDVIQDIEWESEHRLWDKHNRKENTSCNH